MTAPATPMRTPATTPHSPVRPAAAPPVSDSPPGPSGTLSVNTSLQSGQANVAAAPPPRATGGSASVTRPPGRNRPPRPRRGGGVQFPVVCGPQAISGRPASTSALFTALNGRVPKNFLALSGLGCADSITVWCAPVTSRAFLRA